MSRPEDLGEVHWLVALEDPVDLPAGADLDALVHYLRTSASQRVGATGARAAWATRPFPHHAWQLIGGESRSQLWIAQTSDRLHLFVAGPEPLRKELTMWAESLAAAKELLVGGGTLFEWAAIVGPDPDDPLAGPPTFADFVLGDLTVRRARRPLAEWRETQSNLGARRFSLTWPVVVEGTARGYEWSAASRHAAPRLRRLAALLSALSAHPWVIRQDPAIADSGTFDVPETLPAPEGFDRPDAVPECRQLNPPRRWLRP